MKLTKYAHACFTVEEDGRILVIDPGVLSPDYAPSGTVDAVVITHEHADHFDPSHIDAIRARNPEVLIVADQSIIDKLPDAKVKAIKPGDTLEVGPFHLKFFGGEHEHIHPTVPVVANVGVLINDTVYYPGDSFAMPDTTVDTLAVPLGGPWMKTAEAIDFLTSVKPRFAFPTHDAVLSEDGQSFNDNWLKQFAEKNGVEYRRIDGQTIEL